MSAMTLVRVALAYFSAVLSLYCAWRFFKIAYPRLVETDPYLIGVYAHIGLLTWILWISCSLLCYFCAGAIEQPTLRITVIGVVGAAWGAVLFVELYFGWLMDWYRGSFFW
jgi:hypothetical protein